MPTNNMPCVQYKFSSKLNYDSVTFHDLHISLADLKKQIMGRERLKPERCDLQITNAQTQEEYTDETALIPKNSSVIVRRIPSRGVSTTTRTYGISRAEPVSGTSKSLATNRRYNLNHQTLEETRHPPKRTDDTSSSNSLAQLVKTANLAEANASEEDKIKAMMFQSCHEYDPIKYMKTLDTPPPSYICFRCLKPGHYIKNCPTNGDKQFDSASRIKKSTGIPRSFMVEVEDPKMQGAMLTNTGKYAIPTINAEAYAVRKKEKPIFLPQEPSSSSEEEDPIPDELLCVICEDLMNDAAIIPCCGNSYCDECIRTALLESDNHTCPTCHHTDVSPDDIIANKFLRQAVNNFNKEISYTKRSCKHQSVPQPRQQTAPPPPRTTLQPTHPLMADQQDPLIAPTISAPASTSTPQGTTPTHSRSSSTAQVNPQASPPLPLPVHKKRQKPEPVFQERKKAKLEEFGNDSMKKLLEYKTIKKRLN